MSTDDALAQTPHLIPVDHAGLHPCPQCGARQWLQGVTYYRCEACGYQDGLTPQEILNQPQAGTQDCTLKLIEPGPAGKEFKLFVPIEAYSQVAELAGDLHAGTPVLVAGKLKWT